MGEYDNVLGVGDDDPQAISLQQQQLLANLLRKRAGEYGPGFAQAGNAVVPTFGSIFNAFQDRKKSDEMQQAINQGMTDFGNRRNAARVNYLDQMMMSQRRQYPNAGTVLPPSGEEDR